MSIEVIVNNEFSKYFEINKKCITINIIKLRDTYIPKL